MLLKKSCSSIYAVVVLWYVVWQFYEAIFLCECVGVRVGVVVGWKHCVQGRYIHHVSTMPLNLALDLHCISSLSLHCQEIK